MSISSISLSSPQVSYPLNENRDSQPIALVPTSQTIPLKAQQFSSKVYEDELKLIEPSLKQFTPEKKKANVESIVQQVLSGIAEFFSFVLDRTRDLITSPAFNLGIHYAHRGAEVAANVIDISFAAYDFDKQHKWQSRSKPLGKKDLKTYFKQSEEKFNEKRIQYKPHFEEWIRTLLAQNELSCVECVKQLKAQGIDAEALTGMKGQEAVEAIRQALAKQEDPLAESLLKAYTQHRIAVERSLFLPVKDLIHTKQKQLKPFFQWDLGSALLKLGLTGPMSALLIAAQVAVVAGSMLFPPTAVLGLSVAMTAISGALIAGSIALKIKRTPNTCMAHLSGLTAKIWFTKFRKTCIKFFTHFSAKRAQKRAVQYGKQAHEWTKLALNLSKELEATNCPEKRATLIASLQQIEEKRSIAWNKWENNHFILTTIQSKLDYVSSKLKVMKRRYQHARMADFMLQRQSNLPYLKTPLNPLSISRLMKALKIPKSSLPFNPSQPELQEVVRFFAQNSDLLSHPKAQAFLKKTLFKNRSEEVSLKDLEHYLVAAKDPLKLRTLAKELIHYDPNLSEQMTQRWIELGMQVDLDKIRSLPLAEREKALYRAFKKHVSLDTDDMRELIREQSKLV